MGEASKKAKKPASINIIIDKMFNIKHIRRLIFFIDRIYFGNILTNHNSTRGLLKILGFDISISDFYIYEQPAAISRAHAPKIA
jgi:hypothetical protein